MRLPIVNPITRTKKQEGLIGGLDTWSSVQDGYFADMKNMSSDHYPAAGPRQARGEPIKTLEKPNGLYWKNGLAYVDGEKLYYKDQEKGTVADSKKVMVGMGAYIIILPDKVYLNTDSGEFGSMEKTFAQASTATFAPSYTGSTYTKISCTGIGKQFNQYDGVEISGCTNADYNKTATIQAKTDDSITIIGVLENSFTQASGLKVKRKVPDMDFLTECENRLWGCSSKNHEVYASKLGDPLNWNVFEGISTDSYAATIGSDGDFTAAATYSGYALFFKEHTIHKVFGNKPSNIQIQTQEAPGVKNGCSGSVQVVGTTLIYLSGTGVYGYTGGVPFALSDVLEKLALSDGIAGKYQGKYYLSAETGKGKRLLVYDTEKRLWHKEDDTRMLLTAPGGGQLYYVDQDKNVRTITGGDELVEWYLETGDLEEGSLNRKYIGKIQFMIELERGSQVDVFLKHDSDAAFRRMITIFADKKRTYSIPIKPMRCFYYRWRLEGKGKARLIAVGKYINEGSEI